MVQLIVVCVFIFSKSSVFLLLILVSIPVIYSKSCNLFGNICRIFSPLYYQTEIKKLQIGFCLYLRSDSFKLWDRIITLVQDPDNQDGVIANLEPDILECKVEGPFKSITMNKARLLLLLSHFKSCLTLWNPMENSPPGSSVHRII